MMTEHLQTSTVVQTGRSSSSKTLATVALVLSVVGLVLCLGGTVSFLAIIPGWYTSVDQAGWFYLTVGGALGLFPAVAGLVLGVVARAQARGRGQSTVAAGRAVTLSVVALAAIGSVLLAAQILSWAT
jgi:hypothetical protein